MNGRDILKKLSLTLALVVVYLILLVTISAAGETDTPSSISLIVKMASGLSGDEQAAVVARNGGVEISAVPALRLHIVEVGTDASSAILLSYQSDPQVERAEVNLTRKAEALPPDPLYGGQWALSKIGWDSVFGSFLPLGQATVAVLDTGVDVLHPDLSGNIVAGTSIIDGSGGTVDPNGHGTSLTGIVAAVSNNVGIVGVGFSGVKIMPVTVLGADGTGQDSDIIAGVIYAVDHGADVILMGFSNPGFSQNLQDAIDYAWDNNVVLVASTGNDATSEPTYPAGDRAVIGVSSTDSNDALSLFSNYGTDISNDVFLAAPGENILTTGLDYVTYPSITGTSASAAIVAGVAAFIRASDPLLTNGVIAGRLARTADPAGTQEQTGNGRVNMARALSDTSMDPIEPAGAPGGGPYVGPYVAALVNISTMDSTCATAKTSFAPGEMVCAKATGLGGNTYYIEWFNPLSTLKDTSSASTTGNLQDTYTPDSSGTWTVKVIKQSDSSTSASVTFTVTGKIDQATLTVIVPATLGYNTSATLTSSGGSGTGAVSYNVTAGSCSIVGDQLTANSGTNTCKVTATKAADDNYNAITSAEATVTLQKADQAALTLNTTSPLTYAQSETMNVIGGTAGGAVTYNLVSGPCTIVGNQLTANSGTGSCSVTATMAGNDNYNDVTSSPANTVTLQKANQATLTLNTTSPLTYNQSETMSVAGGSTGGAVTYNLVSGPCTVVGNQLTANSGTGSCSVTATMAGNDNYNEVTSSPANTVTLQKAAQAITVTTHAPTTAVYNTSFTVAATGGGSGNPVAYSSGGVCTNVGATFTMKSGTGTCTVKYDQAGNDNYNAAPQITETVTALKADQAITVDTPAPATAVYDTSFTVAAHASSGLAVAYSSGSPSVCSNSGDTFTMLSGTGTCVVQYDQAGDTNYNAAPQTTSNTTAQKVAATVSFDINNPAALQVSSPGGTLNAGALTLEVYVTAASGNVNNAGLEVSLTPLSGGGAISLVCTPVSYDNSSTPKIKTFTCTSGVTISVNTYDVTATINGDYYSGVGYDGFTAYDPSLGFATGGGWFYWPGTTDKTNFGFTMKYNKNRTNLQGNLLVIRHFADGSLYRMKRNSLGDLALGTNTSTTPYGWASFNGKATYLDSSLPDASPVGNYSFTVYVEDNNEPGTGNDKFWMECKDSAGIILDDMSLSKVPNAAVNALNLSGGNGGNIVVPHSRGK